MTAPTSASPPDLTAYLASPGAAQAELDLLFGRDEPLVIFDIGACEGEDSIRYARLFPRAKVFAFEPLPANQDLIRANLARHIAANVELVPLALSDRAGEEVFHVSSGRPREEFAGPNWNYGNKSSSLLSPVKPGEPMFGWIEFKRQITVRTTTLDAFCLERKLDRLDFIHVDVQGAEHLVLQGAVTMLPRVSALWLEVSDQPQYIGQKTRIEMEAWLHRQGFELTYAITHGVEGDQFYVNRRHSRVWPRLARCRLFAGWRRVRTFAGRLRRALLPA